MRLHKCHAPTYTPITTSQVVTDLQEATCNNSVLQADIKQDACAQMEGGRGRGAGIQNFVFIYARHRQGVRFHLAPFRNRFQIAPLFFLFRFSTHTGIVCTLSCCLKQTLAKRPLIVKLFADQINCISSH